MPTVIFVMLVILVLAIAVIAMVVMGMEGQGRHRAPEMAHALAKTAAHLNGEADPPRGLITFFEEAEEGAEDLKSLPDRIRSRASARSAHTASSARSASSARTPASAASAAEASGRPQAQPQPQPQQTAPLPASPTTTWADFSTAKSAPVQEISDHSWSEGWADDQQRGKRS